MVTVIFNIDNAISSDTPHTKDKKDCNLEIFNFFKDKRIIFPIVPASGMLIDLIKFCPDNSIVTKLTPKTRQLLITQNIYHKIFKVIICDGYLELQFH